jgi:hypothetical protein
MLPGQAQPGTKQNRGFWVCAPLSRRGRRGRVSESSLGKSAPPDKAFVIPGALITAIVE